MKPNSAVAVLATSVALLLAASPGRDPRGRLRRLLGAAVCALAFGTLAEYATGIDLGVDQLLAADPSGYLKERWDVAVTHTISDDAFDAMERELEKLEVDGNGDGKP
jgi:hypothetical protein